MIYKVKKTNEVLLQNVNFSEVEPTYLVSNDNESEVLYKTAFRLLYNDEGIFFKFDVEDDYINCTMSGYNEPIYDEETVELFISSTGQLTNYLELEWNAIGGVFCANVENDLCGHTKLNFVKENILKTEIFAEKFGYSIRGFIPKSLFTNDKLVGEWKFNAYRIKRDEKKDMLLYAYSPTIEPNFHKPSMFATLIFE